MPYSTLPFPRIVPFTPPTIAQAVALLQQGELVGMPTETVYGLAADAASAAAVSRIYAAKGRPSDHPVIVHIAPDADPLRWFARLSPEAEALISLFWPGPLTIIGPRAASVLSAVSGGQQTVGLRCPSHPVAIAMLMAFRHGEGGLAAPSANRFGRISPTTAEHVREEFASTVLPDPERAAVSLILDGGPCEIGIESTIIDLSRLDTDGPVILRPGIITAQQIATCLQRPVSQSGATVHSRPVLPASVQTAAPRVSGALESHYAPSIPLYVMPTGLAGQLLGFLGAQGGQTIVLSRSGDKIDTGKYQNTKILTMPDTADGYARQLYAALRQADQAGVQHILMTELPDHPDWSGIADRVKRAAFGSLGLKKNLLQRAGLS